MERVGKNESFDTDTERKDERRMDETDECPVSGKSGEYLGDVCRPDHVGPLEGGRISGDVELRCILAKRLAWTLSVP